MLAKFDLNIATQLTVTIKFEQLYANVAMAFTHSSQRNLGYLLKKAGASPSGAIEQKSISDTISTTIFLTNGQLAF